MGLIICNCDRAIFDIAKIQGAVPLAGTSLPFVLISHASMRRLSLSVNERVLLCGISGVTSGEVFEEVPIVHDDERDGLFLPDRALIGRVWPSTMASGAAALVDEFSRSRLGLQFGNQVIMSRLETMVSSFGLAARLFLSPLTSQERMSRTGVAAGIVLAHQLSEYNLNCVCYFLLNPDDDGAEGSCLAKGSIVQVTLHGRAISMCVSGLQCDSTIDNVGGPALLMVTGETAVSVLAYGEEPPVTVKVRQDGICGARGAAEEQEWSKADFESAVDRVTQRVGGCDGAVRAVVQAVSWSLVCAPGSNELLFCMYEQGHFS
jgi:hypothetical protein